MSPAFIVLTVVPLLVIGLAVFVYWISGRSEEGQKP